MINKKKKSIKNNPSIDNRMNFLIGHLKSNLKMVEEGRYCIDIIRQNQAVISALKKVNEIILRNHLDGCVTTAIKGNNEKDRQRMLDEITDVFREENKQ
ncbi:MAG: metal-sensitive transcriptional regulator [Candidatus Gottesmanbacteria bacterium]